MKQAVFFDLDGTLWDAVSSIQESWNQTMERLGMKYRYDYDTILSTMGLTPEETLPITFYDSTKEEGKKLFRECIQDEIRYLGKHPGVLYPNEKEVLEELRAICPLYIVSNADRGYIENYLTACHMEQHFDGYLQAGDTGLDKWQNILYLQKKEGIDEVIYVGDTDKDRRESEKAHALFIHASYGFGKIDVPCEKIRSLVELIPLVRKYFLDN